MTVGKTDEIKQELARKVESTKAGTKLKKSMSIADMIKVMEPQIKKALPEVITPERFTRMALSALNTTPKLNECTPMSFLAALMNAAQLGLEPNTPLGQAFLIPYNNKGEMECQFQLGYKGLIDLSYRNPNMQIITAHTVYENDEFEYELGLNPCLNHRPTLGERGEIRLFYGLFKLTNGGFGFEVMSKTAMDDFAKEYSKAFVQEVLDDSEMYDIVRRFFIYSSKKQDVGEDAEEGMVLNNAGLYKVRRLNAFVKRMEEELQTDKYAFVKTQLQWLGVDESFDRENDLTLENRKIILDELINYLIQLEGEELDKNLQAEFRRKITEFMHNNEYEFKAGRVAGKSAINEFFKMMQINYVVDVRKAAKKGDVTKWFIRRKSDGVAC